jgi:predicted secreted protein
MSQDLSDATTKDSGGYAESIPGLRSFEISFDGLVDYTDAQNVAEFLEHINSRDKLDFTFGTAATGDQLITGECYVANIDVSGEAEGVVTYSGTLTGTGTPVFSTNA